MASLQMSDALAAHPGPGKAGKQHGGGVLLSSAGAIQAGPPLLLLKMRDDSVSSALSQITNTGSNLGSSLIPSFVLFRGSISKQESQEAI